MRKDKGITALLPLLSPQMRLLTGGGGGGRTLGMQSQTPRSTSSARVPASSKPQWRTSTVLLFKRLPVYVDSTSCNLPPSSSTPSSNRDSGLGSLTSNTSSSFSSYPSLSSNAIAFSIENLLHLSTPKQESSFTRMERALQPLNLSTRGFSRPRTYSCRYCCKAYSSRSSMRYVPSDFTRRPIRCLFTARIVEGAFHDFGCWRVTDASTRARDPSSVRCAHAALPTARTCVRTSGGIETSDLAAVTSREDDVDAMPLFHPQTCALEAALDRYSTTKEASVKQC
ncbi:hypothetical protein TcWFU_000256 [Taenia crassiceps]|uniref:Uncharacterized protein n=1 Tax=Taenia crassiceps TaxID=6207 RepID=A0ABR4QCL4_9CEST